jgi:hypothetical protein
MRDAFHLSIEKHWREHRPKMVKALEAESRLHAAIEEAAERTAEAESAAIQNGMSVSDAQELYREEWAFLPPEHAGD